MPDEDPVSELETGAELLRRRFGLERPEALAILLVLIPWLVKRHRKLS